MHLKARELSSAKAPVILLALDDVIGLQTNYNFQKRGLKTGVENGMFWSAKGSEFGESGGTTISRIHRPPGSLLCLI